MTTEKSESKLKFDPTINAGHMLTFAGFLLTISIGWATLDKRVVVLEEQRRSQELRDQSQDNRAGERIGEIREALGDIKRTVEKVNDKLERKK